MKRIQYVIFTLVVCCACVLSCKQRLNAADLSYYNSVSTGKVDKDGYYVVKADSINGIEDALEEAHKNATQERPYKIIVKPSDSVYMMDSAFILYGNTYLYAQGASFKQVSGTVNNMIRIGNSDNVRGYYYKNIVIDGGTWDENNNSNTMVKIAQTKNMTVKNATFKNVKDGHIMEVAGVDGFTISKCNFMNQKIVKKNSKLYEAVQLDILVKKHFKGYRYQDLAIRNVSVSDCTFSNVPRGIGSHTTVLNNPINEITISNNTFTQIKSCAVQLMNVKNCTISDNTIDSAPRGITILGAVFDNQDTYLSKTLSKQGKTTSSTSTKYKKPASNMKIVISNNDIKVDGKDPYASYEKSGIFISGFHAKKAYKSSSGDKLPKGNYYVSGVTISNNIVKGNCHGVKLVDVYNTKVNNNKLDFTGSMGKVNYYGIVLKGKTKSISVTNNIINKHLNGIYVKDAGAGNITGNTIKNVKKYGISIERSSASKINNNIINKAKRNGIHIWDKSSVKTISANKLTGVKARGIYVGGKSKVTTISKNKFKSCKEKINVNKDSKVKHKQK